MMLFAALLRSSSALWVGPLAVALAFWYANRSAIYAPFDPYLVEHTAAGADPLFLTLAVVAACAAWEGGRLHRAGWIGMPDVRPSLIAVGPLLAPPLIAGFAATAAGLAWKLHLGGTGPLPDVRFVPTLVIVVMAIVVLGFAVGTRVPVAISAPAMLVGVYLWMAFPGAIADPIWLRHLSGSKLGACCGLEFDIDARALVAPIVVSAGIICSALILLHARPPYSGTRVPLVIVPLIIGLAGGATLANGLSREPAVPRASELLTCSDGTPRVCVWPEHQHLLPEASELAPALTQAWSRFGVAAPSEFTEALPGSSSFDSRTFGTWNGADSTELMPAFSSSMLPEWPECAQVTNNTGFQPSFLGADAYDYVLAWFEATGGVPRDTLVQDYGGDDEFDEPGVLMTVDRVRTLPPDQQQSWLTWNLAALASCDVPPRLEP